MYMTMSLNFSKSIRSLRSAFIQLVCVAVALGVPSLSNAEDAKKMNVVFILADDLGWADTTLYGHTELYETPNLERLSQRGMLFSRAYSNSPLCSPTRASILTGQTVARHGSTAPQHHLKPVRLTASTMPKAAANKKATGVKTATRLDTALPTLGKLFKGAGYATAHFGKWHLGPEPYSPLEHGFDIDIPHHPGPAPAGYFVAPWRYKNFKENYPKEHIEDRMAQEAVTWLKALPSDQPFFLNFWQFSVHAPFDAKEELVEYYRGKVDPDSPQRCAIYAAMVHSLDDAVGTLLDALDATGRADNTVIVFVSDNGGNMYNQVEGTTATSNAPLRGGKANIYEGGIRVPCVVVWPGVAEANTRSDAMIQTSDFYTTLLNGMGIEIPADHHVDGVDIAPALKGGDLDRQSIITYFPHSPPIPDWLPESIAVHSGDWKLIRLFYGGENDAHDYLLYNLKDDVGETTNLASMYPERVQDMDRMIEAHLQDAKTVVPLPNPNFDPAKYKAELIGKAKLKPTKLRQ